MMIEEFFRYSKINESINIGTSRTKLTIFLRERCACFTFNGRRVIHRGNGWNN